MSYVMGRSDTVIRPLTGQHRQLIRPRHAVVAWRLGRWSRRLSMVLYEQRQLYDGAEVVVAVDTGLVELTVEIVLEASDDDVWVHGEDCDERRVHVGAAVAAEQYVNLQQSSYTQ